MTKRRGDGNKITGRKSSVKRGIIAALVSIALISFISFSIPITAKATEEVVIDTEPTDPTTDRDSYLTGSKEERTNINPPGASEDPDDLQKLNIANTVTVTYDNGNGSVNGALRILITLTLLSLAPTLLVMMTSFTRIIVALHFTRTAIGTQTSPPNLVMIGIALFMTLFIMQPTLTEAYNTAVIPFEDGQMDQTEFIETAMKPFRQFMYGQTQKKDVLLFMQIDGIEWDGELDSIPNVVLIPSFIVSELRTAFIIGFLIYIPFIVIDMVVASVLMSMGMMMLPPTTISMPFKVLLFVLADGWSLIIGNLVKSFY
ncbi:flagellar biosynthetic protein FliP [Butyrivibrio sp. Su6]|uniref:flagellar type III secretion system pore protein FliP n=1 Tax=unclassified Butyrivibrio TaxID=2639466 RepID=UPI0003B66A29|nr:MULTISPECIES: flagellar type III secretion system pore protein FliP [unclassified Butyrivibrio]SEF43695.1 flagellar biosynthetic protein FliP [Butyrivibrio sp. Su6]